ncbi:MAG: D-alanyl-D-alanine carboxypeptidase [Leptolyngbya sp.]|nr:D-alanyl-D-alanine carboxypeptidase [Leptolyngbya sp.]
MHPIPWQRRLMLAIAAFVTVVLLGQGLPGAAIETPTPSPGATLNWAEVESSTLALAPAQLSGTAGSFCPSDLRRAIASIANQPQFGSAQWGIIIESAVDGTVLYEQNADVALIPASNVKLWTTAAALEITRSRNPQALGDLTDWITVVNRDSNNNSADRLLRSIGGQQAVRQALAPLGVDATTYIQVDGSGLSRQNRGTPAGFMALLRAMRTHAASELFYRSLPVGGVTGTLRNRFRDTFVEGQVRAKTGTLRGVRALSGYVESPTYGPLIFSILINQPGQSGSVMVGAIDQMVLQMARVSPCA